MKTIIDHIKQARAILTECNKRADVLQAKANKLKYPKTTKGKIQYHNTVDALIWEAERLRDRGNRVWTAVTDYQGPYINWRSVFDVNGARYHGITELLFASLK